MNWIDVKDRLPGLNETVLVYMQHPLNGLGMETKVTLGVMVDYTRDDFSKVWMMHDMYSVREVNDKNHITHWMPLPEIPEIQ